MSEIRDSEKHPLKLLIDEIINIKISGYLKLPVLAGQYVLEEITEGYAYDDAVIVELKINNLSEHDFYAHIDYLRLEALKSIKNKIDLKDYHVKNFRVYNEALQEVDYAIEKIVNNSNKHVAIENKVDVKKMRREIFNILQFAESTRVSQYLINFPLTRIKDELKKELTFFQQLVMSQMKVNPKQSLTKTKNTTPLTFEDLFYTPSDVELCLSVLRQLHPPFIGKANDYIGKNKGIFPAWVSELKNKSIIKHFSDMEYKDLLNSKISGLHLSKDASEFRKTYSRVEKIKPDLQLILSQLSLKGKPGK